MTQLPEDKTSNDQIAAHLSRQDTLLDQLFEMFKESIADRAALHEITDGHHQRLTGLEARMTVREQAEARVERAIKVQLRFSDWWEAHKIRANLVAGLTIISVPIVSAIVNAIFRHLGW